MPEKSSSSSSILKAGDIVNGRYLVREELGSGNFSNVYACFDLKKPEKDRASQPLALKVLKKEFKNDAYFEKKMLELLDTNDTSSTAKVCKMYDFFEWKDLPVFIMPVHGAPLRSRKLGVGRGVVTRTGVIQFAYELLETLHFIHFTCHMVHTDLKPENILIADRETPSTSFGNHWVICDFGSASQWDMAHLDSDLISTRPYRAPEVVLGAPWFYAADIWSAGCIIFEVAVGNRLFEVRDDNTHLQLMAKRLGPLPELYTVKSRHSPKFFNRRGEILQPSDAIRTGKIRATPLNEVFRDDPKMLELLMALLTYDPRKRITANKALLLPIFDRIRDSKRDVNKTDRTPATPAASSSTQYKTVKAPESAPAKPGTAGKATSLTGPRPAVTAPAQASTAAPPPKVRPLFASEGEEEEYDDADDSSADLEECMAHAHRPSRHSIMAAAGQPSGAPTSEVAGLPAVLPFAYPTRPVALKVPPSRGLSSSEAVPMASATTSGPLSPTAVKNANSTTAPPPSTGGVKAKEKEKEKDKEKEKEKDKEKDKRRKSEGRTSSGRGQLNVDDLSTILLDEDKLQEAVQSAEEKRKHASKHSRKSASGYLVESNSGSVGGAEDAGPTSPSSAAKERSASFSPLSAADVPGASHTTTSDAISPTALMAAASRTTFMQSVPSAAGAMASTTSAAAALGAASTTSAVLSSTEKHGKPSARPLTATAMGGALARVSPPAPLTSTQGRPPTANVGAPSPTSADNAVVPLTVVTEVGPVDPDAPAITAYETSTQRGARTHRRTSLVNEGSLPRLQRSVSRDRVASATPSRSAPRSVRRGGGGGGVVTTPGSTDVGGVPSPNHPVKLKKKVRRGSQTSASTTRTPRGHKQQQQQQPSAGGRSPRVASGRGNSRPGTPRASAAQGKTSSSGGAVVPVSGTHVTPVLPRYASITTNAATSVLSKDSSLNASLNDPQGQSYRMHRMPPALAAKSQRATNQRRAVELSASAQGGGNRGQTQSTRLIVSRPGLSASSRVTSVPNSQSTRAPDGEDDDDESAVEMLSRSSISTASSRMGSRDQQSAAVPPPPPAPSGDPCETVIANNRLAPQRKRPATLPGGTMLSLDELVPVTVASPFRTNRQRGLTAPPTATTAAGLKLLSPRTPVETAGDALTALKGVPSPVAAACRTKPQLTSPMQDTSKPMPSMRSAGREETFFLDAPVDWSGPPPPGLLTLPAADAVPPQTDAPSPRLEAYTGRLQRAGEVPPTTTNMVSAALYPPSTGAVAASADEAGLIRFPRFPTNEAKLAAELGPSVSDASHVGAVSLSAATSTTSFGGGGERQMRAMIAKPRGLSVSSSDDDNGTDFGFPPSSGQAAPLARFGPAGVSPHGTAQLPITTASGLKVGVRKDSDLQNISQGSVDRLVAALYGGTNMAAVAGVTATTATNNNTTTPASRNAGADVTAGIPRGVSTSAITVHAMPAPPLSYAGVTMKPMNGNPNTATTAAAGLSNAGPNPAAMLDSATAGNGGAVRTPRSAAKGDRSRRASLHANGGSTGSPTTTTATNYGVSQGLATSGGGGARTSAGLAGPSVAPRGRRSLKDATVSAMDDVDLLSSAVPYVAPHANAAVHLPYSDHSSQPPSAGGGAGSPYGRALPLPQHPARSNFTGLLPYAAGPTITSPTGAIPNSTSAGVRRLSGETVPSAMPNRPIYPVAPVNSAAGTLGAPGRNSISPTSGAGYSG